MMKHIISMSSCMLQAMAWAVPYSKDRISHTPRYIPNYPGIQFNNGTFSITVFSDLHFGDCKSSRI